MSDRLRRIHRWVGIAFTLGVLINIAVLRRGPPPFWIGLLAFVPLAVLQVTGLVLFVLPAVTRRTPTEKASS